MATITASQLPDWLLAHGRTAVTTEEVADFLGSPADQVRSRLRSQVQKKHMFSPSRGLWVPVPPKYRTWGATPALEFIDDMMRHLGRDYYVGWLSAAELYAAAHQRPQVFQVAVDKHVDARIIGRNRMRFVTRASIGQLPRREFRTSTSPAMVATPELIAFDLVDDFSMAGGVSNAATVLTELCESPGLSTAELGLLAAEFPVTTSQRLGYLLDLVEAPTDTRVLDDHVQSHPHKSIKLLPRGQQSGEIDSKWGIFMNTTVEPDQ